MWNILKEENKKKYETLITNFASLSEAFSQKLSDESNSIIEDTVAPIVNSKFQETVFQKSFDAVGEDIANTSYDASLKIDDTHKYLVGIKSFGLYSGDQKIAQFKSNSVSDKWENILKEIKENADHSSCKEEADALNENLYKKLAIKISTLRNTRIASSKEQIKGFNANDDLNVEAVYHVLMPSKKGKKPQIFVGEIDYLPVNISKIEISGSTKKSNPTNFKFTDGEHNYKYTSADSQLYMDFNNRNIIVDSWDVNYVKDPFYLFENLHKQLEEVEIESKKDEILDSISWMIANKNGEIEESSGFNGFDGASKLPTKNNTREKRIEKLYSNFKDDISKESLEYIISHLNDILLQKWKTDEDRRTMKSIRKDLINYVEKINNQTLIKEVKSMVCRPLNEMYIPIPGSRAFHNENPHFFGNNIGLFKEDFKTLLLDKNERKFKLEFLASGDVITAYINQENGKAIQSYSNQGILGEWILRRVFQLKPRELLTGERLDEIGINAIRLKKFKDKNRGIGLEFIWIDQNNPPSDAIGWVSK